jgi:multicomponent Na+:H+ antiporter subunit E
MEKARHTAVLFTTLLVFWVALNGSLAADVVAVGVVTSLVIAWISPQGLALISQYRATPKAVWTGVVYVLFFLKELVKSNVNLAKVVLNPALPIRPGIVKTHVKLKSPMGRMLLCNSITLTPGTLSVELDGEWLYVHWVTVDGDDIDTATASIVSGFEQYLEVMYG